VVGDFIGEEIEKFRDFLNIRIQVDYMAVDPWRPRFRI
jgi:hypothetical protein